MKKLAAAVLLAGLLIAPLAACSADGPGVGNPLKSDPMKGDQYGDVAGGGGLVYVIDGKKVSKFGVQCKDGKAAILTDDATADYGELSEDGSAITWTKKDGKEAEPGDVTTISINDGVLTTDDDGMVLTWPKFDQKAAFAILGCGE